MPYYAVANGRQKGVYNSWNECQNQVNRFPNAKFKKFNSLQEANSFAQGGSTTTSSTTATSSEPKMHYIASVFGPVSHSPSSVSKPQKPSRSEQITRGPFTEKIYVDGASRGNGQNKNAPSGYGVYYGDKDSRNASVGLHEVDSRDKVPTNQRAELHAMKHALRDVLNQSGSSNKRSEIYSDSNYSIQSIDTWSNNWRKNGWKNSKGEPVANADIIKSAVELKDKINETYRSKGWEPIKFVHVKGHAGNYGNEQADRLANLGADKMSGRK